MRYLGWVIPVALAAFFLAVILGRGRVVGTTELEGRVIERAGRKCIVEAPDGDRVRLLCHGDIRAGMTVRMKRLDYSSGRRRYLLDPGYPRRD